MTCSWPVGLGRRSDFRGHDSCTDLQTAMSLIDQPISMTKPAIDILCELIRRIPEATVLLLVAYLNFVRI
jgi:hypothetical protein